MVLERKTADGWLGLNSFRGHQSGYKDTRSYPAVTERHYLRFAAMAGVRGPGPSPKGLPDDCSALTKYHVADWNGDGHSHSWMALDEAAKLYNTVRYAQEAPLDIESYQAKYPASYWFDVEDDEGDLSEYRIVFWFDN
jgi:hypothetical protein